MCGHCSFPVESVFRYWGLTHRKGGELKGIMKGSPGGRQTGSAARFGGVPRELKQSGRIRPGKWSATGPWMESEELITVENRKEGKMIQLLSRPVWTLDRQIERVFRYQQLTQRSSRGFDRVGVERFMESRDVRFASRLGGGV